jgi:O-acetyl-ADP-ribose deacetylase (regulator of RNase III)
MIECKIGKSKIILKVGDITDESTEGIVNAANEQLKHGGGVARAIVKKGGQIIQEESDKIGKVEVGNVAVTSAGKLKAKYIIHAVGPRMGEGKEDEKLKNATINSLKKAKELGIKSIAFPAISTGAFGFPVERCAKIMLESVKEYLRKERMDVVFCLFSERDYEIFKKEL